MTSISFKMVKVFILNENSCHFISCSACNNSYSLLSFNISRMLNGKNLNIENEDLVHFLITSIFDTLNFLKRCPIFDSSALCLFTKRIIPFEYVDFVSLHWKLHNPYQSRTRKWKWKCSDPSDKISRWPIKRHCEILANYHNSKYK